MLRITATAISALALGGTAAFADMHDGTTMLDFPLSIEAFESAVPGASVAAIETIDADRDDLISRTEFDRAVEADIIDDPRTAMMQAEMERRAAMVEFPMSQEVFLETVPGATLASYQTIDTARDGFITEDQFDRAVEAGVITDPRVVAEQGGTVRLVDMLSFPMTEREFLGTVPGATLSAYQTIAGEGGGSISQDDFDRAIDAGIITDPRI